MELDDFRTIENQEYDHKCHKHETDLPLLDPPARIRVSMYECPIITLKIPENGPVGNYFISRGPRPYTLFILYPDSRKSSHFMDERSTAKLIAYVNKVNSKFKSVDQATADNAVPNITGSKNEKSDNPNPENRASTTSDSENIFSDSSNYDDEAFTTSDSSDIVSDLSGSNHEAFNTLNSENKASKNPGHEDRASTFSNCEDVASNPFNCKHEASNNPGPQYNDFFTPDSEDINYGLQTWGFQHSQLEG